MAIITLTTDWKSNDFYAGAVKGAILSHFAEAKIIDINHQIAPFNIAQAAFVLRNSFEYFPKGSVHILDVNSEATQQACHIAVEYAEHFFIGADNGAFGLIFNEKIGDIIKIDTSNIQKCYTFPGLYVFAPIAAKLAMGKKINTLGTSINEINRQTPIRPVIDEAIIAGSVIFIDSYQNAITNISSELFERVGRGRKFEILVQSNHYKIKKINRTYSETSNGELLAIFNSANLLEIAINKGNVAELLNLSINSNIRIKFFES